jgi:hypothetical protein
MIAVILPTCSPADDITVSPTSVGATISSGAGTAAKLLPMILAPEPEGTFPGPIIVKDLPGLLDTSSICMPRANLKIRITYLLRVTFSRHAC